MFILEEPYVSRLLLDTIRKEKFEILENDFIKNAIKEYYGVEISQNAGCRDDAGFNLIDKTGVCAKGAGGKGCSADLENRAACSANFIEPGLCGMGPKGAAACGVPSQNRDVCCVPIYTNSENSIDFILENFSDSNLARAVKICKDKAKFRHALSSLYPKFFFKEVSFDEIDDIKFEDIKKPFIIKPSVGFLSLGVHKVRSAEEFSKVKKLLGNEISGFSKLFPKSVVNISKFILEEIITGVEYAVDAYFDNNGKPVILNILKHPFLDENDVNDRAYITSKKILKECLAPFAKALGDIGAALNLRNFPLHIELIKKEDGGIIPVEINPLRFAGWCTTDLAYFAYNINVYEYYMKNMAPDWEKIFGVNSESAAILEDEIFYFAIAERPKDIDPLKIKFDYETFFNNFSHILEKRKIDYTKKPVFSIVFGAAQSMDEIEKILKLDMGKYCMPLVSD